MPAVRTKDGARDLSDVLAEDAAPKPVNPVAGEVSFTDHKGRQWVLRPTFEAVQEIEDALGMSVVGLRTKFAMALTPGLAPTAREHGVVIAAGIRAAGVPGADATKSARLAWETGYGNMRQPLSEFLWALCDGGRGRADDLGKAGSSNGSRDDEDMASATIKEIERRSGDTSGSPS